MPLLFKARTLYQWRALHARPNTDLTQHCMEINYLVQYIRSRTNPAYALLTIACTQPIDHSKALRLFGQPLVPHPCIAHSPEMGEFVYTSAPDGWNIHAHTRNNGPDHCIFKSRSGPSGMDALYASSLSVCFVL